MGRSWSALLGVIVASGCTSGYPVMVGRQEGEIALPEEPGALIQMRRNGCPDRACPIYSIAIFPDGSAVYDGRANVRVTGRWSVRLSAQDLYGLISALDAMDFLDSASNCCVCADAAPIAITLDYRPGTVAKTVVHDLRCATAPPGFSSLERQIDRVTGVGRLASPPVPGGQGEARPGSGR